MSPAISQFVKAVQDGDQARVRLMLRARPALVGMDLAENNEHQALHFAVLRRDAAMVKILMEAGANARKGIYPHRDATAALTMARERGYSEIVEVIGEEERSRREEQSCPNATISPVQDQIVEAIRGGDNAEAMRLLSSDGSLIHACDLSGATPLHAAARCANEEMTAWLLARRAGLEKEDPRGLTPLDHAALRAEPFEPVAALLREAGACVTIRAAIAMGDEARVRGLVESEPALLREISPQGGLLTLAVNRRQCGVVRVLLELGADPDERITLGTPEDPVVSWGMPLWHAARIPDYEIAKILLERGADPNANVYASGWPIRNAWNHADRRVRDLLLEWGARVHPYMVAESHDVEQARMLLADDPTEETVNELVWESAESGCPEILALALPFVPWAGDDPRWHWVMIQPIRGIREDGGEHEGNFRTMQVLLGRGIDPNVERYGQRILHFAAAYTGGASDAERARFAGMLIDHGARLDVRDDLLQSTPLGWACRWGRRELARTLLERGASAEEPDGEAWARPRVWAEKMGRTEILRLLG